MSAESGLFARLIAVTAVTDLLGDDPMRFFPERLPDSPSYPAATYQRVDTPPTRELAAAAGHARPRFQIDIWGTSFASVRAVANAVRGALDGYSDATLGAVAWVDERSGDPSTAAAPAGSTLYRVSQDYMVGHTL